MLRLFHTTGINSLRKPLPLRQPCNGKATLHYERLEDRLPLAVLTVTNLDDAGDGSLRAAMVAANGSLGVADEIQFAVAGTIQLQSPLPTIVDNLTIRGPGAALLTVDAGDGSDGIFATGDGFRHFTIDDGSFSSLISVGLHGLTLTGGDTSPGASGADGARGAEGGAIWSSERLLVEELVIVANATGAGGDASRNRGQAGEGGGGGGIFNYGGRLTIDRSQLLNNQTGDGGASSGRFAQSGSGGPGGGVLSVFGELTIRDSTISGNRTGIGGAASGYHGFTGRGGAGGGVTSFSGSLDISASVVDGNRTGDGGAATNSNGVTQEGGRGGVGGGIVNGQGTVSIVASEIIGNLTGRGGSGNTVNGTGGYGGHGGAVYSYQGQLSITTSTISGNTTGPGGEANGELGLGGPGGFGGGIFAYSDTIFLAETTVSYNQTGDGGNGDFGGGNGGSGGGIYSYNNALSISRSTISGNLTGGGGTATLQPGLPGPGGGLHSATTALEGDRVTRVWRSTISGNTSAGSGGGVFNTQGLVALDENTITNNRAMNGAGSGIASVGDSATLTRLAGNIVSGNHGSDVDWVVASFNSFQSLGFNLMGTGNAMGAFAAMGDQVGIADPRVGLLADNGGPTHTHALLPDSPAVDAGDPSVTVDPEEFDQRGAPFLRVVDGGSGVARQDIGAVEQRLTPIYFPGDYNQDGTTNLADYVVWRDTLGSTSDLRANGDNSGPSAGVVDEADYVAWKQDFGNSAPTLSAEGAIPWPAFALAMEPEQPDAATFDRAPANVVAATAYSLATTDPAPAVAVDRLASRRWQLAPFSCIQFVDRHEFEPLLWIPIVQAGSPLDAAFSLLGDDALR